tara:strand:- start:62 stop:1024 length:963 start_codon:yes stop_codon:yes gene_type:complete
MIRTAECITPKHPDKICDRISDAILDACLEQDSNSRVAIETCGGHGKVFVTGEITTNADIGPIKDIVERVYGEPINVTTNIVKQSNFIAQGVDTGGAGDQGIMVGYACDENEEYIPQELYLARSLCKWLYKKFPYDGKTQVTIREDNHLFVVTSFQNTDKHELQAEVSEWLKIFDGKYGLMLVHSNPAGDWSQGGFDADAGVTGRKLVVDNYGPRVPIGGGAFSGKDSSKVDRSGAYMARRIAVNELKEKNLKECWVYLSYAIGKKEPLQATVTDGHDHWEVPQKYSVHPNNIIKYLDLKKPKFEKTAEWGHMGTGQTWG